MKWLFSFVLFGVAASAPQFNPPLPPGGPALKSETKPSAPFKFPSLAAPFPPQFAPPPQPFQPGPPMAPPAPMPGPAGGVLMDLPNTGGGYAGGYPGYAPPVMMRYCPPGPTSNDACKDQKLQEALYHPDGRPRYNWVPPRNPWDTSLPDTVKDTALNVLMMKVNSRPGRVPTPKEAELMSLLGDPKDQHLMGFGGAPHAG
ncbi:basic proline-rich protein-like isoform X3 [Biomphalaria glabrata]|uniref:Basic proline-rich protein-like isoform X3 n=1 Tax=Biomphalaria glabrata TaxID=6526 RepID=A0A9W2ZFM3_BIOGL|nr:basic proline-rich protein-like isoform X3 [Biomphalaria glabrata]